jgi:fructan beta-fructosidase
MMKYSTIILTILFLTALGCRQEKAQVNNKVKANVENYIEPHRPQFHFTPPSKWMNDPNGMFYYDGEYHLSYQYYPDSTVWGPMHWGHAISKDLVRWEHLPIALYPDSLGLIFSGGTVVDINNTSGFGSENNPPMVATFTHHDMEGEKAKTNDFQKQSIAYSTNKGRSWTKYAGNPVIPNLHKIKDFRDPKVVWHEESKKWILSLAAYDKVQFFSSANLKDWIFISEFGIKGDDRLWECPDLFPMVVEDEGVTKWVLIVSIQKKAPNGGTATAYFVGDFDGTAFKSDPAKQKWLDWGADNYAFVTWDNIPKDDGRRIGIGWMSNWQYAQIVPTEVWRSAMTLPRELVLYRDGDDFSLRSSPVVELESLRKSKIPLETLAINDSVKIKGSFDPSQCELDLLVDLEKTTANQFGMELSNELGERVIITIDKEKNVLTVDRTESSKNKFSEEFYHKVHTAPITLGEHDLDLTIFLDASSLEIFADNGVLNFTDIFFPTKKFNSLSLFSNNGELVLKKGDIYSLKGIWN